MRLLLRRLHPTACALLIGTASAFQATSPLLARHGISSYSAAGGSAPPKSALTQATSSLDAPSSCNPERRRFTAGAAAALLASVAEPGDSMAGQVERDPAWPGTSVARLRAITERVLSLSQDELDGPWPEARRRLLWAGGLKDMRSTSHAFNDWNHCDLTPMADQVQDESNADGAVAGISRQNMLGEHIRVASLPEVGPGGSWSTCILGASQEPPSDVAHVQFRSRIAFKLVWAPPTFDSFVLVDDEGKLLAKGTPQAGSGLPSVQQRQKNYEVVRGGRYAAEAEKAGKGA